MAGLIELAKSPSASDLVSSFIEDGWDRSKRPLIVQQVKAGVNEVMANINLVTQVGQAMKTLDGGIFGRVEMKAFEKAWPEWVQATYTKNNYGFLVKTIAGFRRSVMLPPANFARAQLGLVESSFVEVIMVPEGTPDSVIVEINIIENTKQSRGVEALRQLDHIKSAVEKLRRDPFASKAIHVQSLSLPRATGEKYLEFAELALRFPMLRLGEISGMVESIVPPAMASIVELFQLGDTRKAAYAAVYAFKGIASSSEMMALRDGRMSPGGEPLKEKMGEYQKGFGDWLELRKPALEASAVGAKGLVAVELKDLLKGKGLVWNKETFTATIAVAYLMYKGKILSAGGGEKQEMLAKSKVADIAAGVRVAGLGEISSILEAVVEGKEDIAKGRAAKIADAGPALSLVLRLVQNYGKEAVIAELAMIDDRLAK